MKLLYLAALLAAVAPAYAEIYRCADGDTISFSDRPCVLGDQLKLSISQDRVKTSPVRVASASAPAKNTALHGTRRAQIEASIEAASRRLELLHEEKRDALSAFGSHDSLDAQVLAHHYANIIQPLEQELVDMRTRLEGSPSL